MTVTTMATKNNRAYWEKRMLEEEARSSEKTAELLSRIKLEYKAGQREIDRQLKALYETYGEENGVSASALCKGLSRKERQAYEKKVEELLKAGGKYESRKARNQYLSGRITRLEALRSQAELEIERISVSQDISMLRHLREVYEDSYYHNAFYSAKAGIAGNFNRLNPYKVEEICKIPWSGKSFSERIWANTDKLKLEVRRLLSTGSICGTPVKVMSQKLAARMGVSYHRAECLVRTESAYIREKATLAGYERTGVESYRILATLDSRTSSICQAMDGKVFAVKDAAVGENYPPLHPNCRSTTVPVYDDFKIASTRAAKDENNKAIEVPNDMTYPEWYQKYIARSEMVKTDRIPIKGLGTTADDNFLREYIDKELSSIPAHHQGLLYSYIKEINITDKREGRYDAAAKVITIPREAAEEPGVVIHELAHALEAKLGLFHNEKFLTVLNSGLENVSPFAIITDEKTFSAPIDILDIPEGKFVTRYQRRVYDADYDGNGPINYSNYTFNTKTLIDYFAEGYHIYCLNPEVLKKKDPLLYQFIEELE